MAYSPGVRDIFKIVKRGPRKYGFIINPNNDIAREDMTLWTLKVQKYLHTRDLVPKRCDVKIMYDDNSKRWYLISFSNLKDAFMFDLTFGEIIKQDYNYG